MKPGPAGKSFLILPNETPNEIGIVQEGLDLVAVSGCCMDSINYGLTARGASRWLCVSCRCETPLAPSRWGMSSQHSMQHVNERGDLDWSTRTISTWIYEWTGLDQGSIKIGVRP